MPECSQPSQPLLQKRIAFQRADQHVVQLLCTLDVLAAQPQQRPHAGADLFVGRHQSGEVAHLLQPALVVLTPVFINRPETRYFICTICLTTRFR